MRGRIRVMPHDVAAEGVGLPHEDATERVEVPHGGVTESDDDVDNHMKRRGIVRVLMERYRAATRRQKSELLDEFVGQTGYHRKHAVRLLRTGVALPRRRFCDEAMSHALIAAWEVAGRAGSRRLKDLLPELVRTMAKDGRFPRDPVFRAKLLTLSAATIDRVLASVRAKSRVTMLEERLQSMSNALKELAAFALPADLTPDEERYLSASLARVVDGLRQTQTVADTTPT